MSLRATQVLRRYGKDGKYKSSQDMLEKVVLPIFKDLPTFRGKYQPRYRMTRNKDNWRTYTDTKDDPLPKRFTTMFPGAAEAFGLFAIYVAYDQYTNPTWFGDENAHHGH